MTSQDIGPAQRPFYFMVVLWGERFRDYFLDYCLPSLLAPGNIPALDRGRRNKFLIATRPEDWAAMAATPIFRQLERYLEPVYIEIPPCPPDKIPLQHLGVGHQHATAMCHRDKAYGVVLSPDLMISDGTMARVQEHAQAGKQAVMVAALRFGEEPFFANLRALGAIGPDGGRRDQGSALALSGRQMAAAAIDGFHSETQRYEWDSPYFSEVPVACWWRVPDEEGIVVHGLSWVPLLLDYSAVAEHDTSALETWTIDGDYVFKNFKDWRRIQVIQDSDEMFIASWTPLAEKAADLTFSRLFQRGLLGRLERGAILRSSHYSDISDPLRRALFFVPVRWHARSLNDKWRAVERRALRTIVTYITPPKRSADGRASLAALAPAAARQAERLALVATSWVWLAGSVIRAIHVLGDIWRSRGVIFHRLGQIARGDRQAKEYVTLRVRVVVARLLGRPVRP